MIKEKEHKINEEEAVRAFLAFKKYPPDKQAFAIAFINGMEFQRKLDSTGNLLLNKKDKCI